MIPATSMEYIPVDMSSVFPVRIIFIACGMKDVVVKKAATNPIHLTILPRYLWKYDPKIKAWFLNNLKPEDLKSPF